MWWMMIFCTLPLVILLLAGGKLFSAGYLWPILIVGFIGAHFWIMLKGHRSHNHDDHEDTSEDKDTAPSQTSATQTVRDEGKDHKSKSHGGCCH